jgi:hypothetical protein
MSRAAGAKQSAFRCSASTSATATAGQDIGAYVYLSNSLVTTVMVLIVVLLFWTPFLGMIATAMIWKNAGGWMKIALRIPLALAIIVSIAVAILLASDK